MLEREKFLEIINTIFKNWSQLEREAIIFQVSDSHNNFQVIIFSR